MENLDYKEEKNSGESNSREAIHSQTIRAGKRTYFFDVKSTRNNEFYLTITESKKKFDDNGNFHYEKHKLFLYPEDFDKFSSTLNSIIEFIDKNNDISRPVEYSDGPDTALRAEESDLTKEQDQIAAELDSGTKNEALGDIRFEDI